MFLYSGPLAAGNAVALIVKPDSGSSKWRVLRRTHNAFTGPGDSIAALIAERNDDAQEDLIDYDGLTNGTSYTYRHYCLVDGEWVVSGADVVVTPLYEAEALHPGIDVTDFVRERLTLGLNAEKQAGLIAHKNAAFPVLATHPSIESVAMPVVTVILQSRKAEVRGIGEGILASSFDSDEGLWSDREGWLDRSIVQIAVWALNHRDRNTVRDAVQRVLERNLPIFDAANMSLIDVSMIDAFDPEQFGAPVFQSVFTFSCVHPAIVVSRVPPISQVEVTADAYGNEEYQAITT